MTNTFTFQGVEVDATKYWTHEFRIKGVRFFPPNTEGQGFFIETTDPFTCLELFYAELNKAKKGISHD
jgi:hypothetical protein